MWARVAAREPEAQGMAFGQAIGRCMVGSAKFKQGHIGVLTFGIVTHHIQASKHQAGAHHSQILTQRVQNGYDAIRRDAGMLLVGLRARQRVVHDFKQPLTDQIIRGFAAKHFGTNAVFVGHVRTHGRWEGDGIEAVNAQNFFGDIGFACHIPAVGGDG